MAELIDKKYLAGLKYKTSKAVKTAEGNKNIPTERALQPTDVLSFKDNGPSVTLVTADGQKYTVQKADVAKAEKAAAAPAKDEKKEEKKAAEEVKA